MNDAEVNNQLNKSIAYNQREDALINEKITLRSIFKDLSEDELEAMAKENLLKSTEKLKKQCQSIKDFPLLKEK